MNTLCIANAKGGVGKTSTAVHLAAGLALKGYRTLLVDLDVQANATSWLLGALPPDAKGSAEVLVRGSAPTAEELRQVPGREGLTLLPATASLGGVDLELAQEVGGQTLLREALAEVRGDFDFCILDCPPNLQLTVLNALCAADAVLVPVQSAFLSLTGLRRLEDTLARARKRLHVRTHVLGYVHFSVDGRESISAETRELLQGQEGAKLLGAEVRVSTAAKALPAHHRTAWDAGADPRGAEDYAAVLDEVLGRLGVKPARKRRAA